MELWDAYNSSFLKIENVTLVRGEPIPKDIFHLVCEILVKHVDGTFLLMKRDPQKHFGGMWEATAGGSALAGENSFQCAIRELREETGIISTELIEVGREVNDRTHSIYIEFLCVTDWNKDEVLLQEGETVDYAGLCEGGDFALHSARLCNYARGFITRKSIYDHAADQDEIQSCHESQFADVPLYCLFFGLWKSNYFFEFRDKKALTALRKKDFLFFQICYIMKQRKFVRSNIP